MLEVDNLRLQPFEEERDYVKESRVHPLRWGWKIVASQLFSRFSRVLKRALAASKNEGEAVLCMTPC